MRRRPFKLYINSKTIPPQIRLNYLKDFQKCYNKTFQNKCFDNVNDKYKSIIEKYEIENEIKEIKNEIDLNK